MVYNISNQEEVLTLKQVLKLVFLLITNNIYVTTLHMCYVHWTKVLGVHPILCFDYMK